MTRVGIMLLEAIQEDATKSHDLPKRVMVEGKGVVGVYSGLVKLEEVKLEDGDNLVEVLESINSDIEEMVR